MEKELTEKELQSRITELHNESLQLENYAQADIVSAGDCVV